MSVIDNLIGRLKNLGVREQAQAPVPSAKLTPIQGPVAPKLDFSNIRSLPMTLQAEQKTAPVPVPQLRQPEAQQTNMRELITPRMPLNTPFKFNSILDTLNVNPPKSEDTKKREAEELYVGKPLTDKLQLSSSVVAKYADKDWNGLYTPMFKETTIKEQPFSKWLTNTVKDIGKLTKISPLTAGINTLFAGITNIDVGAVERAIINPSTIIPTLSKEGQQKEFNDNLNVYTELSKITSNTTNKNKAIINKTANTIKKMGTGKFAVDNTLQAQNQFIGNMNAILPALETIELNAVQQERAGQGGKAQAYRNAANTYINNVPNRIAQIQNSINEFMQADKDAGLEPSHSRAQAKTYERLVKNQGFETFDDYISQDLIDLQGNKIVQERDGINIGPDGKPEKIKTKAPGMNLTHTDIANYLQQQSSIDVDRDFGGWNPARVVMNEVNATAMPLQASLANTVGFSMQYLGLNPLSANDLGWMSELNTVDVDNSSFMRASGRFVDQLTDYAPETAVILPQVLYGGGMATASVAQGFRAVNAGKKVTAAKQVLTNIKPLLQSIGFNSTKFVGSELWINSVVDSQVQNSTDIMSYNANVAGFALGAILDLAVPAFKFSKSLGVGSDALRRVEQEAAFVAKNMKEGITADEVIALKEQAKTMPSSELPSVPYQLDKITETMKATEGYVRQVQQEYVSQYMKLEDSLRGITDQKQIADIKSEMKGILTQRNNFNKQVKTGMLGQELLRDLVRGVQLSPERQAEIGQMLRLADNNNAGVQTMMDFIRNQDTRQQSDLFRSEYFNEKSQRELSTTDNRTLLNMFELRTGLKADRTFTLADLEDANTKGGIFEWLTETKNGKYVFLSKVPGEDTFRINTEGLQKLNSTIETKNIADVRNTDAPSEKIKELFEGDDAFAKVDADTRARIVDTDVVDNYIEEINRFIPCIT